MLRGKENTLLASPYMAGELAFIIFLLSIQSLNFVITNDDYRMES